MTVTIKLKKKWPVRIAGIGTGLPDTILTSEEAAEHTGLSASIRHTKLGIKSVRILGSNESTSDLAVKAIEDLFRKLPGIRTEVQFLILVTQNPDYKLPSTACIVQQKSGIPDGCLTYDVNQGCSGFVVALAQAAAFIESGLFTKGLVVTADPYNRVINPKDKDTHGLFGDAAAAVLVEKSNQESDGILGFFFGTNGSGAEHLIVRNSGTCNQHDEQEAHLQEGHLFMNGRAIFEFVSREIPTAINAFLSAVSLQTEDIDQWVFHQANKFMNERLANLLAIPKEKAFFDISNIGNTVSSSIPLALVQAAKIAPQGNKKWLLCGFGVGLSWAGCLIEGNLRHLGDNNNG